MQRLKLELENCYGIKKLKAEFDFSERRANAIYAPNGTMKSSLARTFRDVGAAMDSKDCIFLSRVSVRKITDENDVDLPKESVFVIQPYDDVLWHNEKTSTLLVDNTLRKEYEDLHVKIDRSKQDFLQSIKEISRSKKNLEQEISTAFTRDNDEFYRALIRVKDEVRTQKDAPFASVHYDKIFDEKILAFLDTKDFKTAIKEYVEKYNELLAASTYFKKGVFNYYNAASIAKSLADNGFFEAMHTISLNADERTEITTEEELKALIQKEKDGISSNEVLRRKFAEIEKQINKNTNLRDFHDYLLENEELLPQLANIEKFKEEIWKSYFKVKIEHYNDLIDRYEAATKRKEEIEEAAKSQRTQWESVIQIFNNRFFVPFRLIPKNKVAVTLGSEPILNLGFTFEDGDERVNVEKADLMSILSMGEKKALYILNIIFEIEVRKKAQQDTIFIIDDIADSFDYKNKYAIIEYLKDISEDESFSQIILTHNFDFFRTVFSRFVGYKNCWMVSKSNQELTLERAVGIKNIFVNDWKNNFYTDQKKKIASIPFIRNIIEYTKGDQDPSFLKLTSLLHWKIDSADISQSEIDLVYKDVFGGDGTSADGDRKMMDIITQSADECLQATDGINFENKIVLSIAIRVVAEQFMINAINDSQLVIAISSNQTARLFGMYRKLPSSKTGAVDILQRVVLMTPESIHLNSFMYEPILDMSDGHLRQLYKDIKILSQNIPIAQ